MQAVIFLHADAHDDVSAALDIATRASLARHPEAPLVYLADESDPLAPDLGGLILTADLSEVVFSSLGDLMWGAAAMVRRKNPQLGLKEVSVAALKESEATMRDLAQRGVSVHFADMNQTLRGGDTVRLGELFGALSVTATEWNEEDKARRSDRSRA